MEKTTCTFGPPFSANKMYAPAGWGVLVKTRAYKRWIERTVPVLRAGLDPPSRFPVEVEITVVGGREWHEGCDTDNVLKPIMDALVRAGVLPDDRAKYVSSCKPRFMPFGRRGEALTMVRIIQPEDESVLEVAELVVVDDPVDL